MKIAVRSVLWFMRGMTHIIDEIITEADRACSFTELYFVRGYSTQTRYCLDDGPTHSLTDRLND